jgi:peptidoglycan hydrolase CwlO-like protein
MKRDYLYLVILILGFLSLYLGGYINFSNKSDIYSKTQAEIDSLKQSIKLSNETLVTINTNIVSVQDSLIQVSSRIEDNNKRISTIKDDLDKTIDDINSFTSNDVYLYFASEYNIQQ